MNSILLGRIQFFKKMYHLHKNNTIKMVYSSQFYSNLSKNLNRTNSTNAMVFLNWEDRTAYSINWRYACIDGVTKLFPNQQRYSHSGRADKFPDLQTHTDFSKKLNFTDKEMTEQIGDLIGEWLRRFDTLGDAEANVISGTLNTLSRLVIFDKMWSRSQQAVFEKIIVRLCEEGNGLLDPKSQKISKFTPWQIANCLNAFSKWNVLDSNAWENSKIHLFKSFIGKLIDQGDWLMDPDNKTGDNFNSKAIANILNALSKWNLEEFPQSRRFIVRLMKQNNDRFTSLSVVKTLNAMSKWHVDELQGAKEFIIQLMKQGIAMANKLNSQEVANSLNALSKWNVDELQDAKGFIIRLIERGYSTVDQFNCQDTANSLNALSKWNINDLQGAKEFIIRLVKRGSGITGGFKPQEISNCLNAVSKWNIEDLPGTREFIVQLVKCGNLTAYKFTSQGISNSLNALSKWNVDEFEGVKEFIYQLVGQGCTTIAKFNSQSIANSLNALAKWKIDELQGSREFIECLIKRGVLTIDGFGSQATSNSLNALGKWNVDQFPDSRQFIIRLIERGISTINGFEYQAVANTLHTLSKWNIDEFEAAKEFISSLIKMGNRRAGEFDSQSVANTLNALSKWNIDQLRGAEKLIIQLVKQGNLKADKFNPQEIGGTLNAFRKFSIFDSEKWSAAELKIFKGFIVNIAKKGESLYKEFDSQSVVNSFNAFWKLDIFNDEKWLEDEQSQLKIFIIQLSSLDEPVENHTLESISCIYSALLDWNIFHNDEFDSNAVKQIEKLVNNLKDRILTIAERKELTEPDVDIRFSAQIIKDLSDLKSKSLILFDTQIFHALMRCFTYSVENANACHLMNSWTQNNILSCLQKIVELIRESELRSEFEGLFDDNLFIIYNHLVKFDVKYVDKVLQCIIEIDELGIITDREMLNKLQQSVRYRV